MNIRTNIDEIKYLERKYDLKTQNMKMKTARELLQPRKWQTVENIVNKCNLKLEGINYSLKK